MASDEIFFISVKMGALTCLIAAQSRFLCINNDINLEPLVRNFGWSLSILHYESHVTEGLHKE